MKNKLDQFISNLNGQFVELSDRSNIYQCMDLAYCWIFALGYPKSTIQHLYAYEAYTKPKAITREYFDIIPNTPDFIPQDGDIGVFKKTSLNIVGHIVVCLGGGTTSKFKRFEQNSPVGTNAHVSEGGYANLLGVLRPKKLAVTEPFVFTDKTKIPLGEEWGEKELQAVRSTLRDLKRDLTSCENRPPVVKEVIKEVPVTVEKVVEVEKVVTKFVTKFENPVANFFLKLAEFAEK